MTARQLETVYHVEDIAKDPKRGHSNPVSNGWRYPMELDGRAAKWNDESKVGNSEEAKQKGRSSTVAQEAARVTRNRHRAARGAAKAAVLRGAGVRARERRMPLKSD